MEGTAEEGIKEGAEKGDSKADGGKTPAAKKE